MVNGRLSMIAAKAEYGWLCHNDKNGNRTKVVLDNCLSDFLRKKENGMKGSMVGAMVATALCD
jgi:hypothetical protein